MAELADALGSGLSSRKGVEVQVLSSAPHPFRAIRVLSIHLGVYTSISYITNNLDTSTWPEYYVSPLLSPDLQRPSDVAFGSHFATRVQHGTSCCHSRTFLRPVATCQTILVLMYPEKDKKSYIKKLKQYLTRPLGVLQFLYLPQSKERGRPWNSSLPPLKRSSSGLVLWHF